MNESEKTEIKEVMVLLGDFHSSLKVHIFGTPKEANRIWKELTVKLERLIK